MTALAARQAYIGRGIRRMPWLTLTGTALLVALFALFGGAQEALVYDRALVFDGELYRLLTGHLVHLDGRHLLFNAGAFAMLGAVYETSEASRGRFALLMAGAIVAVSAFLVVLAPDTTAYCGLSAALNALFAATVLSLWRDTRHWFWPLLLLGDLLKIGFEWQFGSIFNAGLLWTPLYGAHLAGLVFGLAFEWRRPPPTGPVAERM
ncbi:rhombosortase [Rhodobium gokarnense]|uniref:Rhomboid family GlyGly-CTERM serine protease n=1 Tax=Rhodobium gokarnense TaxID=364296 RepID=A0ABT3H9S5_9HYPH|nr:rhombosortase [Rhodobium gokarnense]MCW2307143.1 rhomboid family GlyGly-CTERM serine protease [Rhodobium gokarnense]